MDKRILSKIKACFARANGTDSKNEAATALRQAQKLMAKYNISQTDIDLSEVHEASVKSSKTKSPVVWECRLASMVQDVFATECLWESKYEEGYRLNALFIGFGSAPELSSYAYGVLYRQLKQDRGIYIKTLNKRLKRSTKTKRANLFCLNWIFGAREHVQAIRPNESQMQLIENYLSKKYSELSTSKVRGFNKHTDHDRSSAFCGYEQGKAAQLHKGVHGSPLNYLE